ncbi:MAG: hypothetical protein AAGC57_18955 [Pseudomonadota bacterium]
MGLKRRPDAEALGQFEAALEGIEDAAKAVISEAKRLEKKTDASVKPDLRKTIAVLSSPLNRRVAEWRNAATKLADDLEEDEDDIFGTPDAHRAYLKRMIPRIKRGPHMFALCLPSNDPKEMRFMFHRSKQPRSLGVKLKKHMNTRRFTYGIVGSDRLATRLGITDLEPRTLVIYLEGRTFPSLAKRIRILLRSLKISQFSRVRIVQQGQEITEDDGAPEIDAQSLGDKELADAIKEARAMPGKAAPPGVTASLRRRIATANVRLKQVRGPKLRTLVALSKQASSRVDKRNFGVALVMVERLEKELVAILGKPTRADEQASKSTAKAGEPA